MQANFPREFSLGKNSLGVLQLKTSQLFHVLGLETQLPTMALQLGFLKQRLDFWGKKASWHMTQETKNSGQTKASYPWLRCWQDVLLCIRSATLGEKSNVWGIYEEPGNAQKNNLRKPRNEPVPNNSPFWL